MWNGERIDIQVNFDLERRRNIHDIKNTPHEILQQRLFLAAFFKHDSAFARLRKILDVVGNHLPGLQVLTDQTFR